MNNYKGNIINVIVSNLLIVFSFFIFLHFNQNSISSRNELKQDINSIQINAVMENAVKFHIFNKHVLLPINLSVLNQNSFIKNKKFTERVLLLLKTRQQLQPVILYKFYYHLFSKDAKDLPDLG